MLRILLLISILHLFSSAKGQNMVQLEYFIDIDAGIARNNIVTLSPSMVTDLPITVNLRGITAGYHFLYSRVMDENGKWSTTSRNLIEVLPQEVNNTLIVGEYFFDEDPGIGAANIISVSQRDSLIMQDFTTMVSALQNGSHKLYIRFKDAYDKWSQTARITMDVLPEETFPRLVFREYSFDNDPGFGTGSVIPFPSRDSSTEQNLTVSTAELKAGPHILYQRLKDSYGRWSQTLRQRIDVANNPDTSYIVALEYFYKVDPGFGSAKVVQFPALQNGEFSFNVPFSEIPQGTDSLFIRVRDSSDHHWSLTNLLVTNSTLPLTLLNFTAERQNDFVRLDWITENEFNTSLFTIQRSADGIIYNNIGKVKAKGTSIARSTYNYMDNISGVSGERFFYRLEQEDHDGKKTYSNISLINRAASNNMFRIAPNPAIDYVDVVPGTGTHMKDATVMVTDLSGHLLIKYQIRNASRLRIPMASFVKGIYTISIIAPGYIQTEKILVR